MNSDIEYLILDVYFIKLLFMVKKVFIIKFKKENITSS